MRVILGIQEAHDASAALMIDGTVVAAAQEERFSGLKGDYGFPRHAIDFCLKEAGISPSEIDGVALASHHWSPFLTKLKRNANFSVQDWVKEQTDYWYPKIFEKRDVVCYDLYKDREDFSYEDVYPLDAYIRKNNLTDEEKEEVRQIRIATVAKLVGVSKEKVFTVTHEDCHVYYSYFASPMRGDVLAFTAEGIGDYSNGSVSIMSEKGKQELASTRDNHIGHIYQYITLLLGMKPAQHEYKVMGMAPYANSYETKKSLEVFKGILKVDGLNVTFDKKPKDLYFHFRDALQGHRFDGIAGALQLFVEDLLCEWIENAIAKTGIKRFVFAGGVAQNIKACKRLMEIEAVEEMYICPAAGDSSVSIGACYHAMWEHLNKAGKSMECIKPIENFYLGPCFDEKQTRAVLEEEGVFERYQVTEGVDPAVVARKLAEGKVLGRSSGKMEFGLRALGNRSILADPRKAETINKINSAIKFRDFWMPFTPTVKAGRADDYIINPKGIRSPFMTMAFESTELARKDYPAALHPADFTMRAQILEQDANPEYYAIIDEFEKLTGVGALLNTSFNLHGDPIVCGPKEAIYTLDNSDLDGLILDGFLVERKR